MIVSVLYAHQWRCLQRPEVLDPPGAEIPGSCESPDMGGGTWLRASERMVQALKGWTICPATKSFLKHWFSRAMGAQVFNSNTLVAEAGGSLWVQNQSGLQRSSRTAKASQRNPPSKTNTTIKRVNKQTKKTYCLKTHVHIWVSEGPLYTKCQAEATGQRTIYLWKVNYSNHNRHRSAYIIVYRQTWQLETNPSYQFETTYITIKNINGCWAW